MKTIIFALATLFYTSEPISYKFAVDQPTVQNPVIIDSLICSWNGNTISYTTKCRSDKFTSARRNVILRFTMAGTVPHSTVEIAHGITLTNQKGCSFEIKGTIPYQYEPSMTLLSAQYQDTSNPDDDAFHSVKDKDVPITKEVPHFNTLSEQLLIFADGKEKTF